MRNSRHLHAFSFILHNRNTELGEKFSGNFHRDWDVESTVKFALIPPSGLKNENHVQWKNFHWVSNLFSKLICSCREYSLSGVVRTGPGKNPLWKNACKKLPRVRHRIDAFPFIVYFLSFDNFFIFGWNFRRSLPFLRLESSLNVFN